MSHFLPRPFDLLARKVSLSQIRNSLRVCFVKGALLCVFSTSAQGDPSKPSIRVIDPDKKTTSANPAALDTEHFEIGFNAGLLSVEDFNTNTMKRFSFKYYFNEKVFVEAALGSAKTKPSGVEVSDGLNFISDRKFKYTSVSGGYQVLKGRAFWGNRRKYNSGLYLIGGLEKVDFASNSETGLVIGVSYKTTLTDWFSINLDFKDHIVNRNITNIVDSEKLTHNSEISIGFNTFF
ncbi:MAG: outer membrane beta-barrel domain-containing protein [Agarilytica sp.]